MPLMYGRNSIRKSIAKCWVKWGQNGKKYFFICGNETARNEAIAKAEVQHEAILSSVQFGE